MRSRSWRGWIAPLVVVALAGGYAWADAEDLVPGLITNAPADAVPAPFVTAAALSPGAGPASPASMLGEAPLPEPAAIQDLAQALRDDPRTGASTNVVVMDLVTGESLADVDARDGQVPASTTKVLTALAATYTLGADYRFTTSATFDPGVARVTLVAGGDMMLAADAGHQGSQAHANGWAGLGDLARAVAEALAPQGIHAVTVVVDDLAYPEPHHPPAWPDYVIPMGYGAPVSGLAVNIAKQEEGFYGARWADPSLHAAQVFADHLSAAGVTASVEGRGAASGDVVASVESAPLWRVVEHLVQDSDNTIAELVARHLALETGGTATSATGAAAVTTALGTMGIDTTGLKLYDGAGYSTQNRISPALLAQAIRASMTLPEVEPFIQWMPIGALEGTVASRYTDTPAAGLLRAKTGSLTGVTSLAGVVQTSDGRVLVFATLADGMPYGPDRPRAAIDEFVAALAACGCRG